MCFFKYAGKENCAKNFQPFYKQIKNLGVEGFLEKPSTPFFFNCLYFIGAGGDENLINYLAWPNKGDSSRHFGTCHIHEHRKLRQA